MDLIEQFVARFRKEYDFYDHAARLAAQLIEQSLQNAGIRAIVTSRAKSPSRLEQKLRQRHLMKHYQSIDDIFKDIVDLAGVRVALYFPAERDQVGKIIVGLFTVDGKIKSFPEEAKPSTYKKRFSGYWATHYRVRHKEGSLSDAQKRYVDALIEIQVASVLMHAWAEVEHDLVYKPLQGSLSEDEYSILDELNGLVMSGEIALERLQRAAEARVTIKGHEFSNHYDLAAYLLSNAGGALKSADPEAVLGKISVLFELLKATGKMTPDSLQPYIRSLSADFERRPLSDQIIDSLLSEDPKRYKIYNSLRTKDIADASASIPIPASGAEVGSLEHAIGRFIQKWIRFESILRKRAAGSFPDERFIAPTAYFLKRLEILDPQSMAQADYIRRFRNNLVHGISVPSRGAIEDMIVSLESLLDKLEPPRPAAGKARKKRR